MTRVLLSLVLLVFSFATIAGAQSEAQDYEISSGPSSPEVSRQWIAGSTLPLYGDLDLTDAGFSADTSDEVQAFVNVADLEAANQNRPPMVREYYLRFTVFDRNYQLVLYDDASNFGNIPPDFSAVAFRARLEVIFSHGIDTIAQIEPTTTSTGWQIDIPRAVLTGNLREPLIAGSVLTNISAESRGVGRETFGCVTADDGVDACGLLVRDFLPNVGGLPPYMLMTNPPTTGHLLIFSPKSERASNGEATTYLFDIIVSNTGTVADVIRFEAIDVPGAWTLTLPNNFELGPKMVVAVPVAIQVPFFHQHGATETATIRVGSSIDQVAAKDLLLGVKWVDIPQPAGHHNTLSFHGGPGFDSWMNTFVDDPSAEKEQVWLRGSGCLACGVNSSSLQLTTSPQLSPALELGIDAIMDSVGALHLEIVSQFTATYSVYMQLVANVPATAGGPGRVVLFTADPGSVALTAGQMGAYDISVRPTPEADYLAVPVTSTLTMNLELRATLLGPDYAAASLMALQDEPSAFIESGSSLRLPLNEFHDRLSTSGFAASTITLESIRGPQLQANPGGTRIFEITARTSSSSLDIKARPSEGAIAKLSDDSVKVESGASQPFRIAITLPSDATPGLYYDTLLHVSDPGDASRQAAIILRLEAVPDGAPDDAAEARSFGSEGSNGIAASSSAVVVVSILGLAMLRRNGYRR